MQLTPGRFDVPEINFVIKLLDLCDRKLGLLSKNRVRMNLAGPDQFQTANEELLIMQFAGTSSSSPELSEMHTVNTNNRCQHVATVFSLLNLFLISLDLLI